MAKSIVEANNGDISVKNGKDGAIFKIKFYFEKSMTISIITSLGVMFIISIIASNLRMSTLIKYYDYKSFLGFSLVVYGINLIIYHFSLKRILDRPTIDLIRTI